MTPTCRPAASRLVATGAALAWLGCTAMAQPLQLPGAQPFNAPGTQQSAPASAAPSAPRPRTMPAIRIPGEDSLLGKTVRRNGGAGEATLEKTATGFGLKPRAEGFQAQNLVEPCAISFGETPVPLTSLGKPAGLPRYKLEASACPIVFDVLEGGFLVVEPAEPCVIEAARASVMRAPQKLWLPSLWKSRQIWARSEEKAACSRAMLRCSGSSALADSAR